MGGSTYLIDLTPRHSEFLSQTFRDQERKPYTNTLTNVSFSPANTFTNVPFSPANTLKNVSFSPANTLTNVPFSSANTLTNVTFSPANTLTNVSFSPANTYKNVPFSSANTYTNVPFSPANTYTNVPISPANTYNNVPFSPAKTWSSELDNRRADSFEYKYPSTSRRWADCDLDASSSGYQTDSKVTFVPVGESDIHFYPSESSETSSVHESPCISFLYGETAPAGKETKDSQQVQKKGKLKVNANNNFMVKAPIFKSFKWADENVFDRTSVLAKPKPFAKGFKEARQAEYWISKRPPKVPPGGKTIPNTSQRLDELAKPMYNKGEFQGGRHCTWIQWETRRRGNPSLKPSAVDWDRLAAPKCRELPSFREIQQPVPMSALKFQPTKRLIKLSEPKKKIDCNDFYLWLWNRKPKNESRLKKIKKLSIDKMDLHDCRVFLKCDLDFTTGKPIQEKIDKIVATIHWAFKKKARAVVIASHCGNPNGRKVPGLSLEKVHEPLERALGMMVVFLDDCVGSEAMALSEDPEAGYILLLENTLFHPEELGFRVNDEGVKIPCSPDDIKAFRDKLYSEGDVYINDAFTLLNADVISTVGPSEQDRAYGFSIRRELSIYNWFLTSSAERLVAIIGGMFEDVADLVSNLMGKASEILLGGHIAYCFIKTIMDVELGEAEVTPKQMKRVRKMMVRARDTKCVINLPSDLVVQNVESPGQYYTGHTKDGIDDSFEPVDIGPFTRSCYQSSMMRADKLLWYGMMGELPDGTSAIACFFSKAENCGIKTYLADDKTAEAFFTYCPKGKVTHITEDSAVSMMFLHRKMPKGLETLCAYRKKIKPRAPKPVFVSNKPTFYDKACMRLDNALDRMSIEQLDLRDKKVILRASFDLPLTDQGVIKNNYCIRMLIPTIKYVLQSGALALIILGSVEGITTTFVKKASLQPVGYELERLLNLRVRYVPEVSVRRVELTLRDAHPGTVLLLENVNTRKEESLYRIPREMRSYEQEEQVTDFCLDFSRMGDVYINDAFSTHNENTATTSGCLLRQRACGFLQKSELRYLSAAFMNPNRPFLIILGGSHPSLKLDALTSVLSDVDQIIITGALAFGFLRRIQNLMVGRSIYEPELDGEVIKIISLAMEHEVKLYFPVDFVITDKEDFGQVKQVSASTGIPNEWKAVDIGDKSCSLFRQVIKRSKLILWQGVAGVVEDSRFSKGTHTMLDAVMMATQDPDTQSVSIISGMSMSNFVNAHNPDHLGISHVTTGGLSVFSLIRNKSLPSIRSLSGAVARRPLFRLSYDQLELKDQAVLISANFNLPVDALGQIADHSFLKELSNSIKYMQKKGARSIVLVGHYGNPGSCGPTDESLSLSPAKIALETHLKQNVEFITESVLDKVVPTVKSTDGGKVLMLENILYHSEEKGYECSNSNAPPKLPYHKITEYRTQLGKMCDIYINENFPKIHSCDSTVVGVSCPTKAAGPILKNELSKFRTFVDKMSKPFLAIVGSYGQFQINEKLDMIYDLLDNVTDLMLCGDIAYHFLKVVKGKACKLASTPIDNQALSQIPRIVKKASLVGINIHLPSDFLINELVEMPAESKKDEAVRSSRDEAAPVEEEPEEAVMVPVVVSFKNGLKDDQVAMDIGPETLDAYKEVIKKAQTIVLIGAAGEIANYDYRSGSIGILNAIDEVRRLGDANAVGLGYDTNLMVKTVEGQGKLDHISMGTQAAVDLIRGALLPGLEALSPPVPKPFKKLSVETFNLQGMRVLLRLDLDIPIVEGIILDRTKIDAALPTIRYVLREGARCVTLIGHRGRPRGFKNDYLTLQPLVEELAAFLQTTVTFIDDPCSDETKELLESPTAGSVYLMENLRFYPAEEGRDAPNSSPDEKPEEEAADEDEEGTEDQTTSQPPSEKDPDEQDDAEDHDNEGDENENEVVNTLTDALDNEMLQEVDDPENLDQPMYQLMAPKTVKQYVDDMSQCGDVYVNDDVTDIKSQLTSFGGFNCKRKMCGLRLKEYISMYDTDDVYDIFAVTSFSSAPKDGTKDELILPDKPAA